MQKMMFCEALACKMMQHACDARRDLVKEQAVEEELPRKRGRPKAKVTIIGPEKCLECKTGLVELRKDQVAGVPYEMDKEEKQREIKGLPVSEEYAVAKLGMVHGM